MTVKGTVMDNMEKARKATKKAVVKLPKRPKCQVCGKVTVYRKLIDGVCDDCLLKPLVECECGELATADEIYECAICHKQLCELCAFYCGRCEKNVCRDCYVMTHDDGYCVECDPHHTKVVEKWFAAVIEEVRTADKVVQKKQLMWF